MESKATELSTLHDLKELPALQDAKHSRSSECAAQFGTQGKFNLHEGPFSVEMNAVFVVDLNK